MPENVLYTQCPKFSQWPIEWCFTLQFSVLKMKMLWDTMNITEDLSYIIYREVDWPPWIIFFNHSMFHYHSNIYKLETGQSPQGTLENRLVPVPGSRCIVPQILGIPWVARPDSFSMGAGQQKSKMGLECWDFPIPWPLGRGELWCLIMFDSAM